MLPEDEDEEDFVAREEPEGEGWQEGTPGDDMEWQELQELEIEKSKKKSGHIGVSTKIAYYT